MLNSEFEIGYCDGLKSVVNGSGLNNSIAGEVAEFTVYLKDLYQYPSAVETERLQVQIVRESDSYHVSPTISPLHVINGICSLATFQIFDYFLVCLILQRVIICFRQ